MSFNAIIITVVLLLSLCLMLLLTYLIAKVNDLEAITSSLLNSNNATQRVDTEIFSGLKGKLLWDAWQVVVKSSVDELGLDRDRDRFMMLLELHVRELIKIGREAAGSESANSPGSTLVLKTLRGEFESYMPASFTDSLFRCGVQIAEAGSEEEKVTAITELDASCRRLAAVVLADDNFSSRIASVYM